MVEDWRSDFINKAKGLQPASEIRIIAHRKKAEYWNKLNFILGFITTIISAITSITLITSQPNYEIIALYLAATVTVFSALSTYLKPGEKKANNEIAYKQYSNLSNDIKYFYEIECALTWDSKREAQKSLAESYKLLNDRLSKLGMDSPMLSNADIEYAIAFAQ